MRMEILNKIKFRLVKMYKINVV